MARKSLPISISITRLVLAPFLGRTLGRENIPRGAYILAANHASLLDGVLLATAIDWAQYRPLHMISIAAPFRHWLFGWFLKSARCIPLAKASHAGTERMMALALAYLARGEGVGILPEGHVGSGPRLRPLRPGVALLALESGAPILPVGIRGSHEVLPLGAKFPKLGRRVEIRIGQPLDVSPEHGRYHTAGPDERAGLVHDLLGRLARALADLSLRELPQARGRRRERR